MSEAKFETHFLVERDGNSIALKTYSDPACEGSLAIHVNTEHGGEMFHLKSTSELRFIAGCLIDAARQIDEQAE